jgi:hypothetical protein
MSRKVPEVYMYNFFLTPEERAEIREKCASARPNQDPTGDHDRQPSGRVILAEKNT